MHEVEDKSIDDDIVLYEFVRKLYSFSHSHVLLQNALSLIVNTVNCIVQKYNIICISTAKCIFPRICISHVCISVVNFWFTSDALETTYTSLGDREIETGLLYLLTLPQALSVQIMNCGLESFE